LEQNSQLKYKYAHGEFQIYKLIGPESLYKLKHALNNGGGAVLPDEISMCDLVKNPNYFNTNSVYIFNWETTQGERMVSAPSIAYSEYLVKGYD